MNKITESNSSYDHLEQMSTLELLQNMNREDKTVAYSIEPLIPKITDLVDAITAKMRNGGRLFYIGAGTSGRLDRKSTRLNSSHIPLSRMPSSA